MIRTLAKVGIAAALVFGASAGAINGPAAAQRRQQPQAPAQASGPRKHLALVGGMLIDGYEVPPVHHAAIVIEDNKILEAGPASEVKIPSDATVIDTSG